LKLKDTEKMGELSGPTTKSEANGCIDLASGTGAADGMGSNSSLTFVLILFLLTLALNPEM
jgi:hypothetical protein